MLRILELDNLEGELDYNAEIIMSLRAFTRDEIHALLVVNMFPELINAVTKRAYQRSMSDEMIREAMGLVRSLLKFPQVYSHIDIKIVD